jgi:hypothetical protein
MEDRKIKSRWVRRNFSVRHFSVTVRNFSVRHFSVDVSIRSKNKT